MMASHVAISRTAAVIRGFVPTALMLAGPIALFMLAGRAYGQTELIRPPSADVADSPAQSQTATAGDETADRTATADPDGNREASATASDASNAGRPGETRLAAPDDRLPMEEVIVVNESEWRLPDLGSAWRQAQAEAPETGRISVAWVPLYDPANADPVPDLFQRNSELYRVGMIELVRVRFGGRPKD